MIPSISVKTVEMAWRGFADRLAHAKKQSK
jgi:hypothetical protein